MRLFYKLLLVFIAVVIIPTVFNYTFYSGEIKRNTMNAVVSQSRNNLRTVASGINNLNYRVISTTLYLNDDEAIRKVIETRLLDDKEISDIDRLEDYNLMQNLFGNISRTVLGIRSEIAIYLSTDEVFATWPYRENTKKKIREVIENNGEMSSSGVYFQWIEDIYEGNTERRYFTFFKKLVLPYRKNAADIVISVPDNLYAQLLGDEEQEQKLLIMDQYGQSLVKSKNFGELSLTDYFQKEKQLQEIKEENNGYRIIELKGTKYLLTYQTLDFQDWILVDLLEYQYMDNLYRPAIVKILGYNLFFLVLFLVITYLIVKKITRPIESLSEVMKNTEKSFPQDIIASTSKDEIGLLENSFQNMLTNLRFLSEENIKKEDKKREYELAALQAQICPHFLFNTLNSIKWAALNGKVDKVSDMTTALAGLLRNTILNSENMIPLKEEIRLLQEYIKIMNMRHRKTILFTYELEAEFEEYQIPKLLLQPIIENSIIHGMDEEHEMIHIQLEAFRNQNRLCIGIVDDGIGFEQGEELNTKSHFTSIGLNNVDERIKLHYGQEYGLRMKSQTNIGTVVDLELPIFEEEL